MKPKYIFIDIDGTLFSHQSGIPTSALYAIDDARKNGHKVFINTGRVQSAVDDYLRFFPFDGYIFGAGSHILIRNHELHNFTLPDEIVHSFIHLFQQHQIGFVLEGTQFSYYNPKAFDHIKEVFLASYQTDLPAQTSRHLLSDEKLLPVEDYLNNATPINKISLFADKESEIDAIQKLISDDFTLISYGKSAELIQTGINKATGMIAVLTYFNASLKDTIAIGDSMNDYEMIQQAHIGIAMGNANDKIKAIANYTTTSVDHNGIEQAFDYFKLREPSK